MCSGAVNSRTQRIPKMSKIFVASYKHDVLCYECGEIRIQTYFYKCPDGSYVPYCQHCVDRVDKLKHLRGLV